MADLTSVRAEFRSYKSMADKTLRITLDLPELSPAQRLAILELSDQGIIGVILGNAELIAEATSHYGDNDSTDPDNQDEDPGEDSTSE